LRERSLRAAAEALRAMPPEATRRPSIEERLAKVESKLARLARAKARERSWERIGKALAGLAVGAAGVLALLPAIEHAIIAVLGP
jgi:hypothetical protein